MRDENPSVFETEKYRQNCLLLNNYLVCLLARLSAEWNRTDPKIFNLDKKKGRSFRMEIDEIEVISKDLLDTYRKNEGYLIVDDVKSSLKRHSVDYIFYEVDTSHVDNGEGVPLNFNRMDFSEFNELFQFTNRSPEDAKAFPVSQFNGDIFDKIMRPVFKEAFYLLNIETSVDPNEKVDLFASYPLLSKSYDKFKSLCQTDCEGRASFLLMSSINLSEVFRENILLADCCDLNDLHALDEAFENFKVRIIPQKKSMVVNKNRKVLL